MTRVSHIGSAINPKGDGVDSLATWGLRRKLPFMPNHDSAYKRLLSQPTILRQILQTCIEEDWLFQLDFERLERIDKSFISKKYRKVEADLVFKIPFKESEQIVYLYILLEAQSTVPRFMALRMAHYISSFWMDFVHSHPKAILLPPIFPVVLYNGDEKWTASTKLADLIDPYPDFGNYRLGLEYFKIAENEYDREWLLKQNNLATTLFLAEAHYDVEILFEQFIRIFEDEPDREAVQVFLNWFEQLAAQGYRPQEDFERVEREFKNVEEIKSMLMKAIEHDREELIEIGEARGLEIGEARGLDKGKRERDRQHIQRMIAKNYAIAVIAEVLGLSEAEVFELSKVEV